MESSVVHVYGGGSGIVGDLFGIVAILFGAFALMAWFSVVIRKEKPEEIFENLLWFRRLRHLLSWLLKWDWTKLPFQLRKCLSRLNLFSHLKSRLLQ